jgi:hypothetical protein
MICKQMPFGTRLDLTALTLTRERPHATQRAIIAIVVDERIAAPPPTHHWLILRQHEAGARAPIKRSRRDALVKHQRWEGETLRRAWICLMTTQRDRARNANGCHSVDARRIDLEERVTGTPARQTCDPEDSPDEQTTRPRRTWNIKIKWPLREHR